MTRKTSLIALILLLVYSSYGQATKNVVTTCSNYASVVKRHFDPNTIPHECLKYHRMKIAGLSLIGGGGGIFAAGVTTLGFAIGGAGGEFGQKNTWTRPELIASLVCIATGFVSIMAGLPLTGEGSKRFKRCNRENRAYIQFHTNGLALNF